MLNSNDLEKYYKTISNAELLHILENPSDYQEKAIEIAKKEFTNRQLSDSEINEAKQPLVRKQLQKEKQQEKMAVIEARVKGAGYTILDTLNPIQEGIPTTEKTIRYIVLAWVGIFLYQLISEYGMLMAYLRDIPRFPYESLLVLFPFIFLLLAVVFFWRRKKIGWVLLTGYIIFSIVMSLFGIFFALKSRPSNFSELEIFIPRPSMYSFILPLIIYFSSLYVLFKKNIREAFSINEENLLMTVGIVGLVSFFFVYGLS